MFYHSIIKKNSYFCIEMKRKVSLFNLLAAWRQLFVFVFIVSLSLSCTDKRLSGRVDKLNEASYFFHYRNLDSTFSYAKAAFAESGKYGSGRAEAMNNKAFVYIAKMDYDKAKIVLDSIESMTGNAIELLIADVQQMRICQRESNNKDFYRYRERALNRLSRIDEERNTLNSHQMLRLIYGESELHIVETAYFYYVGLDSLAVEAMNDIDVERDLKKDTAQLLNYFYNMGSGGLVHSESHEAVVSTEMEWLLRCYQVARKTNNPYWEANSLQAISEHMENDADYIMNNGLPLHQIVGQGDELSAKSMSEQALRLFEEYGDVYQVAGSLRTLGECLFSQGEYEHALDCLNEALLRDTIINRAPDLVASIRERLSMVYSALDDKPQSDYNRNIYLDLQEETRQDRQWEARAEQLTQSSSQINHILTAVGIVTILVLVMLIAVYRQMKNKSRKYADASILNPLVEWTKKEKQALSIKQEDKEELIDSENILRQKISDNRRLNIEQRAKVSLVMGLRPLIDRAVREIELLSKGDKPRREYIHELFEKINDYNKSLTRWIEMRRGELNLQVESFRLEDLFALIRNSSFAYEKKGINLTVDTSNDIVKADKALTLFMINTLADNARKYTPSGGHVTIGSKATDDYVEISVTDDGSGMTEEQVAHLFDHKHILDQDLTSQSLKEIDHGFGLLNCKGIIEKYKKTSHIFHACDMFVESRVGKGSRFSFRLPKGKIMGILLLMLNFSFALASNSSNAIYDRMDAFADSTYNCNIDGEYARTLIYADSCRNLINEYVHTLYPDKESFMLSISNTSDVPAEIEWFRDDISLDYNIILSIRNESAVAALALHDWNLYTYNNKVYTQLFREMSTDTSIPTFVKIIERSRTNKNIAVALFVILATILVIIFYQYYHRKRLSYQTIADRVDRINQLLSSDDNLADKAKQLSMIWPAGGHNRLDTIVRQVENDLNEIVAQSQTLDDDIELTTDTIKSLAYENNRLHVSNNVLDNCLSTLKHETMYYPARLQMLIEEDNSDETPDATIDKSMHELAVYYRDIYSILSRQAARQTQSSIRPDQEMLGYMMELLSKLNGNVYPRLRQSAIDDTYLQVEAHMDNVVVSRQQRDELFTSDTIDFRYLVCRQIMREIGEWTRLRGCGINARADGENTGERTPLIIDIIIPEKIWTKLESLS